MNSYFNIDSGLLKDFSNLATLSPHSVYDLQKACVKYAVSGWIPSKTEVYNIGKAIPKSKEKHGAEKQEP